MNYIRFVGVVNFMTHHTILFLQIFKNKSIYLKTLKINVENVIKCVQFVIITVNVLLVLKMLI